MPTYEYLCRSCGDRLEVVQSFTDDPLTVCEACGGELRKVFSAAGLIFKGSGWHIKDYSSSSSSGAKPASGTATSSTPSGDGGSGTGSSGSAGGSEGSSGSSGTTSGSSSGTSGTSAD